MPRTAAVRSWALAVLLLPAAAGAQERLQAVAIEPCRLLDTRLAQPPAGGLLEPGVVLPVQADEACQIPFGARAIQATITATDTRGPGFLSVMVPAGRIPQVPVAVTSVVNFDHAGQTVANASFVKLGSFNGHTWDGSFWLVAGMSATHVLVDVTAYYVAAP